MFEAREQNAEDLKNDQDYGQIGERRARLDQRGEGARLGLAIVLDVLDASSFLALPIWAASKQSLCRPLCEKMWIKESKKTEGNQLVSLGGEQEPHS